MLNRARVAFRRTEGASRLADEQIDWTALDCVREPVDIVEADVPFAALDLTYIAPVKFRAMRQLFLA